MDNLGDLFAEIKEEKRKKAVKLEKLKQEAKIFEKYIFSEAPETPKAVKILEKELLNLKNPSYKSIDILMKGICADLDTTTTQLHHSFKDKHGVIPDEWVKQQKEELDNTIDTNDWRDGYAPTEIETENIIEAEPIKNEELPDYLKGAMNLLDQMGNL